MRYVFDCGETKMVLLRDSPKINFESLYKNLFRVAGGVDRGETTKHFHVFLHKSTRLSEKVRAYNLMIQQNNMNIYIICLD